MYTIQNLFFWIFDGCSAKKFSTKCLLTAEVPCQKAMRLVAGVTPKHCWWPMSVVYWKERWRWISLGRAACCWLNEWFQADRFLIDVSAAVLKLPFLGFWRWRADLTRVENSSSHSDPVQVSLTEGLLRPAWTDVGRLQNRESCLKKLWYEVVDRKGIL